MSEITRPLMLDETGKHIAAAMERQNLILTQMIQASEATPAAELNEIHRIVQAGDAPDVFSIGDQLMLNYNDGTNAYVLPFDIVHFGNVTLQDGEVVPGMYLQSHYAMQGVQFDASEAIAIFDTAVAAGTTMHFTIGNNWGNNVVANKVYQFTTETEIPAGGMVVIGSASSFYTWAAPDTAPANWRAYTFASQSSVAPLDTLTLTEGSGGTDLGTLSSTTVYGTSGPNNLQRAGYGYNRWSQSAMRQFLNSSAAAEAWWNPQNPYDRPPQQLATMRGFMAGFDEAFLNIIKPVKVTTALNTVTDSAIGASEDTYDTFFCTSLEQEYIVPQASGVEGEYWEYWKQRLGLTSPQVTGSAGTNAYHIRYAYNAKTSAQYVRLRSADRSGACSTWTVSSAGYASSVTTATRPCPACVIC